MAETLRRAHLHHEASVKSIGFLYYLCAFFLAIATATALLALVDGYHGPRVAMAAVLFALTFVYAWLGRGLRRLDPRVRVGTTILAALSLLSIPIGTLIGAYILYLLHSAKGKMVFSEDYRQVIAATPEIRYRTSKVVLAIVILGVVLVSLVVLFGLVLPALQRA